MSDASGLFPHIDVSKLFERYPIGAIPNPGHRYPRLSKFYRNTVLPLDMRLDYLIWLRQVQADLSWYREFRNYWERILNGRPLWGVADYYFFREQFRLGFQSQAIPDTEDAAEHLASWQNPSLFYFLFHGVHKETVEEGLRNQAQLLKFMTALNREPRHILDYGCGVASLAKLYYELFKPKSQAEFYVADLQNLAFHYGAYRAQRNKRIKPLALLPEHDFQLVTQQTFDVIFCITVFEHMNRPLETMKRFYELLKPGGLLIFDYIKSDGHGMDTDSAVRERDAVLDFALEHFELVQGRIDKAQHLAATVVRKV